MKPFVDHLQLLPVPFLDGRRQADGAHRPGGLGIATLAERLAGRGWTARIEDIGFDKPMPERRLAEAFARTIADGVLSARDRSRFPIVLTRAGYAALGVIDALGPETGVVWVGPGAEQRMPGRFGRSALDRSTLALVTGRAARDRLAVAPVRADGRRIILVGGHRSARGELQAAREGGIRHLAAEEVAQLPDLVDATEAAEWVLHIDLCGLPAAVVPAADEATDEGVDPARLETAVERAFGGRRTLAAIGLARYDLNRDVRDRTAATLAGLIEAAVLAAGGEPRPAAGQPAGREA